MFDHDDGCLTDIFCFAIGCPCLLLNLSKRDEKIEEVIKTFSKKYVFNILRSFTVSFVCLCVCIAGRINVKETHKTIEEKKGNLLRR